MSLWSAELQQAVYERLVGRITADVFNAVPETARPPYALVGNETTEQPGDFDTHTSDGSEETFSVHVWDNAKGSFRLKMIMARVDQHLHHARFRLAGGVLVYAQRDDSFVLNEQTDDVAEFWRHGVIRYRCWITAADGQQNGRITAMTR